jgi:hypothetical protein
MKENEALDLMSGARGLRIILNNCISFLILMTLEIGIQSNFWNSDRNDVE